MKTRWGMIVCIAVLLAFAVLPATALATPAPLNSNEQMLLTLVNKERTKRGLAKVHINARLLTAARAHSKEMGTRQYFSHDSANGESFSKRLIRYGYKRSGYSYWKVGEDIYYGSGLSSSPVAVVAAWMASPGHRAVILTKAFRDIGVGAVVCSSGYANCTHPVTFFTLDLGRRKL